VSSEITQAAGVAGRYASALFELAEADKSHDAVAADLDRLASMIDDSEDLARMIASPVISRDDQARALGAILEKAEIGAMTRNFVGVVTRNRRLFALKSMISAYRAMLAAQRGETTAEVVSAKPLSEGQMAALKDSLKRVLGTDIAVDASVDANLLGGLVVKVGSRMIDSSLNTKLQQLRLAMKGVG